MQLEGIYKVRKVARGLKKYQMVDHNDLYAIRAKRIRLEVFIGTVAALHWHAHHVDIKATLLGADPTGTIQIELLETIRENYGPSKIDLLLQIVQV